MQRLVSKLFVAALLCLAVIIGGAYTIDNPVLKGLYRFINFGPDNGLKIDINGFAPPNTNPRAQPDFDIFAWNTFIALNWPAITPDSTNGYLRGIPDVSKSFAGAKHDDLLVWETFKEKREIFNQAHVFESVFNPPVVVQDTLYPWNFPVNYGLLRAADTDIDTTAPITNPEGTRIFHQGRKQMTPFNAFDETTEVGSSAIEDTIYGGVKNPIQNRPVGPRVWKGAPSDGNPVLYEVKLNYDYYNYVSANRLWTDDTARINSLANSASLRFPYRTSAKYGPKGQRSSATDSKPSQKYEIATNYSSTATQNIYRAINKNLSEKNARPPLTGTMQIKVAWIKLDPAKDTVSNYHSAKALYYVSDKEGQPVAREGLFGLIGIHIIQRIHINSDDGKPDPAGGTFIFATWEHTSIRDNATTRMARDPITGMMKEIKDTEYSYSNYYNPILDPGATGKVIPGGIDYDNKEGFYPAIDTNKPLDGVYPVPIVFDIIDNESKTAPGTVQVNRMVHDMLPEGSVWKNYQLVGTQFIAIDVNSASIAAEAGQRPRYPVTELDPQGIGLPVYLANLVVETNQGLQKFQGQPPKNATIANYQAAGVNVNNTSDFQRANANTAFNRVAYNMGGCMGCHGVAQSKGFSFSFVLLGGRDGAKTDTETHFESPPLTPVKGQ